MSFVLRARSHLRISAPKGEIEKSFPELKRLLLYEIDNRTVCIIILSHSSYGEHVLEFGDDMKWHGEIEPLFPPIVYLAYMSYQLEQMLLCFCV